MWARVLFLRPSAPSLGPSAPSLVRTVLRVRRAYPQRINGWALVALWLPESCRPGGGARIPGMQPAGDALLAVSSSRGAAYDVVLLAHILAAVVGFGAVAVAGVNAPLLRRPGPPSASMLRYYRPGVNWAGRITFLVPVLGVALVGMSHGSW